MGKALCITGIVIAVIVALLFLSDLLMLIFGAGSWGPFGGRSMFMDLVFLLCAAGLGALSYFTLKEQV